MPDDPQNNTQSNPLELTSPASPLTSLAIAQAAQAYAESIVDTVREPMLILRADLRIQSASRSFYRIFGVTPQETVDRLIYELGDGQWNIPALRDLLQHILPQNARFDDYEVTHDFPGLGTRTMLLNAHRLHHEGNHTQFFLLAMEDVTDLRTAEAEREALISRLNAELTRQTRIAQVLQRPLLLETAEDAFPGLSIATLYTAAWEEAEVGGDFFDTYALADGRVAFLVGDATGKGLVAAARAQECKDVLRAFLRLYPFYPALTLTRLNDYYSEAQSLDDRGGDTVMALSLALVKPSTGEVTLAWGGIEPPLVQRAAGGVETLSGGGMLIGAAPHTTYVEVTTQLSAGTRCCCGRTAFPKPAREWSFGDWQACSRQWKRHGARVRGSAASTSWHKRGRSPVDSCRTMPAWCWPGACEGGQASTVVKANYLTQLS